MHMPKWSCKSGNKWRTHFGSSICCDLVPLHYITSKVSFNVGARYRSFSKSKRSNNKLTRTNTPRNTLRSIFELFGGFAKSRSNLEIICMILWILSLPAVTTDRFPKDVAEKNVGDWTNFLGLDVVRYFIFFGSSFRITVLTDSKTSFA